jgi:putative tributyrin esterase
VAKLRISFRAESLRKETNMTVILPEGTEAAGPFPVLYLLHGMQMDDSSWSRSTRIERYVANIPLIVVMPDGGRSWYTDAKHGLPYETHIVKDVVGFVDRFFRTIPDRRGRAIGGWSMGGYGAAKLAFKHPDLFGSLVASSGVYHFSDLVKRPDLTDETIPVFGEDPDLNEDENVFCLAERLDRNLLPAIRIECGTEDSLLPDARKLHAHLDKLNITHDYAELPGIHSLTACDQHVPLALAFHRKALGV